VVIGNSLTPNNADKHVWLCSVLAGFSNKRMMNKINEFEFLTFPLPVNGGEIIQRDAIGKKELAEFQLVKTEMP
jgi:hypothetical protein